MQAQMASVGLRTWPCASQSFQSLPGRKVFQSSASLGPTVAQRHHCPVFMMKASHHGPAHSETSTRKHTLDLGQRAETEDLQVPRHPLSKSTGALAALAVALASSNSDPALAANLGEVPTFAALALNPAVGEVSAALELSVLLLYLGGLLGLLAFGTFLVVRQVLVRRELENAAKELQERVRTGQASSEEYFELGAVMLRKKFYTLANKYLLQAISKWEGDEQELAQVHNALGFSYFSEDSLEKAVAEYEKAVRLQPAYVTAWNNLGDALEKKRDLTKALRAYESTLMYDPNNRIAKERKADLERRVGQLTP